MSSSRIEATPVAAAPLDDEADEPRATRDLRPRGWIKRVLPRRMFGRALLIVVLPLILLQAIATWIFYDRHWTAVSWRLSSGVSGDVALMIEAMQAAGSPGAAANLLQDGTGLTDLGFALRPDARLPPPGPAGRTLVEEQLTQALQGRIDYPYRVALGDSGSVSIEVQLAQGVLAVEVPRNRLFSSTTYIFVMWMVGSSLVLLAVATIFLRNQIKSLRRLAAAADSFGRGHPVPFFKIEGALEIRQAAIAFLTMRDRIQRQIRQRTQMLAGVSHDLRTPLTRMKLALEMMGGGPTVAELKSDVAEMGHMIDGYLDFARGEGSETPVETDVSALLKDVAATARREGAPVVALTAPQECVMRVRPNALRRCIVNLVGNACRHGRRVAMVAQATGDGIDICIDDDGPGIRPEDRARVFRPFVRLDPSRNASTGGVGLGLTIARDVARSHGGDLRLETSPQGGLRARLHLPR